MRFNNAEEAIDWLEEQARTCDGEARAERALHAAGWDLEREAVDVADPWERRC